jgi:hypothetical protein
MDEKKKANKSDTPKLPRTRRDKDSGRDPNWGQNPTPIGERPRPTPLPRGFKAR